IIQSTKSICPECKARIDADYVEEDGNVYMVKECDKHGQFKDLVAIDKDWFKWIQKFKMDSDAKRICPEKGIKEGCPYDCGICANHKSAPAIIIMDVTYRCNLKCPICFANANVNPHLEKIEPTYNEIVRVFDHFSKIKPQRALVSFFSGGEPTLRDDLPELIAETVKMGYIHPQVATNGIRFAKDIDYLKRCVDAGMKVIYLQFDGVTPEPYIKTRGADIFHLKEKVIENCRKIGFYGGVLLIPTVVKDVNDHQVGAILDYAIENNDIVVGVFYQPVALCGRIEEKERLNLRITSSHVAKALQEHTNGEIGVMYPLTAISHFAKIIGWTATNNQVVEFTCNPICGFGNFLFVEEKADGTKEITGTHRVFDTQKFMKKSRKWYNILKERRYGERPHIFKSLLGGLGSLGESIGEGLDTIYNKVDDTVIKARMGLDMMSTMKLEGLLGKSKFFMDMVLNSRWDASANFVQSEGAGAMIVALMHFQDEYNFDTERVSRCLVHYGWIDPRDNKVNGVPFCAMNTLHREKIEDVLFTYHSIEEEEEEEIEAEPEAPKIETN
ncbi:MAG: radical SAM protein, partial [Candidatus Lokiarchaeota archaeon]|nr:radical SAM protein [Candidatus Lokiarchaeota archaeon]